MINRSDIYQKVALAKKSRCDAFIKCIISIIYCFYIISASLALEVRGRGVYADFFQGGGCIEVQTLLLRSHNNCRLNYSANSIAELDLNTVPMVYVIRTNLMGHDLSVK